MGKRILITGGAGFIGSHLADELIVNDYDVRVFDNCSERRYGNADEAPDYLNSQVELVMGDIRDARCVRNALRGVEAVFHFAAKVGVGQSMFQVEDYVSVNDSGAAVLLQQLIERPVERVIVASSMSLYGEGLYRAPDGALVPGVERSRQQLQKQQWELRNEAGAILQPVPTPESKPTSLSSVYSLTKFVQERLCLMIGAAYGIETVALRFFNVYGPRQALSNPYTGVLAIFAARLLNGMRPLIFEDGLQRRDFVHVRDVAHACRLALETPEAAGQTMNIGSGESHTVLELAGRMASALNKDGITPETTGKYRVGDIRHCFADTTLARKVMGYQARMPFVHGVRDLAEWLEGEASVGTVSEAGHELATGERTV